MFLVYHLHIIVIPLVIVVPLVNVFIMLFYPCYFINVILSMLFVMLHHMHSLVLPSYSITSFSLSLFLHALMLTFALLFLLLLCLLVHVLLSAV